MKIYIAGPITGIPDYKERFAKEEEKLRAEGHTVMNPAILPPGFEHQEYMKITLAMLDVCDAVMFLQGWVNSKGSVMEFERAAATGKRIMYK